ncbi:hypothetical protein A2U14_00965 [Fusobacterium necrophorum subsp. funduliforme]|uniref:hypothetical protein n=1 Tax=Fusobacterium necrophorum TaxID=859 RepID=UPI000786EA7E|nr:hypothetical protein [Fusobacterium necrophorum]AYV92574.1 hypothetical protein BSQ88_02300 [Fusobacterium necrophorum subsp. funduliforme]KYM61921.1 hypothetical protein A2U14_00965 [Fusobacterium necrophorum subsp. funduliforme]KYM65525.1 hypothetical protein A2U16_03230 [Fusobacterium necrophorum subsp. funduliforme]MDK4486774.1 hypothetical protein [Fusobacterium necrophorum]MDK4488614.1 hypothetical protein [Fusobacterium necrophorum]
MRARVKNISRNKKLENIIDSMQIKYPRTNEISSFEVSFQLESPDIISGDTVEVIVREKEAEFLKIQGKAQVVRHTKSYTGVDTYSITVKDSYDTLFEKQVAETKVYYDLYLCNTGDRHNSILHKIATELGFENKWDFQDVVDNKGQFLRVPFVLFEKDTRWIDELQTFMNATGGILYVKNGKLVFRPRNRSIDSSISFHRSNLMTSMEESEKTTNYNGIRLSYDRFEKLENQVVFNLAKKVSVKENTPVGSNVDAMRIEYITSSVSNPTLTKAYGYYFTSTDPNSMVEVELQEGTHYIKEEWKETQAIVKFYNPYPRTLYIDTFEIKGVPLVKYENNEFDCKNKAVVAKNQENFILVPKNKYIQTKQFAEYFTRLEYANKIYPSKKYSFYSSLEGIEVAGVYRLSIEEIQDTIQVTGFTVFCEANNYRMQVEAETYVSTIPDVAYSSSYNLKGNSNYVDLSSIEKKVDETKKDLKTLDRDVHSRLFRTEIMPDEEVQENDIWLNPKTNVWKKFYNNTWNPISEKEILPNMKMYNSLENNMIKLQGTTDKVGAYLLNDGEQFGSMNGELAHVTFDKLGQFEAENPNNRVALNIKDPANPYRVTSQVLLGVTDVTDSKWKNTIFAIGDEATGNRIEFKQGKLSQKINGQELEKKLSDVDKNIINLAQADSENKKELEKRINKVKTNINAQLVNADKKWTALQGQYQETVKDITSFKTQTSKSIDTVQGALQQGNFIITANTTFDGDARFVSRGSNEVITIANGAIDFHRDGKRLTRIKNIRHGTISTDSTGKGVVDFEGFQQPMIVVPSIKSLDAGKNIAKFFCFAEHIERCKYRFFVGVSNEYWVEATPIKVVGTQWTAENAMNSTFLKYEGKVDYGPGQKIQIYGSEGEHGNHWKYIEYKLFPEINVKITRIDGDTTLLVDKNYKMTGGVDDWRVSGRYNLYFTTWLNVLDFSQTTNLLKRYANRTNVKFIMQVSITQPEFRAYIAHDWHYTRGNFDNKETTYYGVHKEVVLARITSSHLTGLALTASSSTSTLGEVTGEGEVSYIAMEID